MHNRNSSTVIERKLRPIYEFLDIGNPKRALQETERLLKKQQDLLCAKALKVLSLIRLNRLNEANAFLAEIESMDTDEEYTLQALTYCYRDLGKSEKIITLYERALKKQPQNEEFLSHVMMAYARVCQFKKQNQFAMQLYKLRPNKHFYYFWSVMATVMQGYESDTSRLTFLRLAERMVQKFLNEDKITAEAEVKLYCMILEMLEKYEDAANLLRSDLAKHLLKNSNETKQKLVELLEKIQKFDDIYEICKLMIEENPDDWFAWQRIIKNGLEIIERNVDIKETIIDEITRIILNCVEKIENSESRIVCRGPYLARLLFIAQLLERDYIVRSELGTSLLGEPNRLIIEYFSKYGDKPCCFADLKPYLGFISQSELKEFLCRLEEENGGISILPKNDDVRFAKSVVQLRKHICSVQLSRCLGHYKSSAVKNEHQILFVKELIQHYLHGLKFGTDLPVTDIQFSDDYLLLATNFAWEIFLDLDDLSILIELLVILEYAVSKSQANYKLKLMLAKFYAFLGCGDCLSQICENLQIKYIMHETLWYLLADQMTPYGHYTNLLQWSTLSQSFMSQSDREIMDNVIQCYKSGSFDRIIEFMEFRCKLQKSFHLRACQTWKRYFTIITECSSIDTVKEALNFNAFDDEITWSNLIDNRDFTVFQTCNDEEFDKLVQEKRTESFRELINESRFYCIINRICSLLCESMLWKPCLPESTISNAMTSSLTAAPNNHSAPKSNNAAAAVPQQQKNGELPNNSENSAISNNPQTKKHQILEMLADLLGELTSHFKHCAELFGAGDEKTDFTATFLAGPAVNFFDIYLKGSYFNVLNAFLDAIFRFLKHFPHQQQQQNSHAQKTSAADSASSISAIVSSGSSQENSFDAEGAIDKTPRFLVPDELQGQMKAMFSNHQLRDDQSFFPYLQMCHISYIVQTNGLVLFLINLLYTNYLNPAVPGTTIGSAVPTSAASGGGGSAVPQSNQPVKKAKKKKQLSKMAGGSGQNGAFTVSEIWLEEFNKICLLIAQSIDTANRLVSDLEMILDTDIPALNIAEPKLLTEDYLQANKPEVISKLKASYQKSLRNFDQILSQQSALIQRLMKK